ncbi:MAG: ATP-binding protein [Moorea sp. SIO4A1]|uniref:ATP-binding protein n=1 Tax=Moorena sp. SIO4A1 TaxID=2607835 RepID=UPI00144F7C2C|nr:ATP-binding protein [Moorena sp. SIO4A1]NEQ63015.1 ATP-binding protein [Moorena sp. SIO4A1]
MPNNPFIVGKPVPPERFVGRTALIETAFDQISHRSNLSVWGGPGIGKSSFLELLTWPEIWRIHQTDPSQAVIVLLNCLSIHPFTGSGFWGKVLSLIKTKLDSNPGLQADIDRFLQDGKSTAEDFRKVLGKLGAHNKFLVLLADDYDAVFRTHETYTEADMEAFLSECRSVAYFAEERQYLSMIVTSSRRLNELGPSLTPDKSPWYNHYLFRQLKPFTKNEVDTLLFGMPMTPALRDGIKEIADGHPVLLQNAGYLLYQELRSGGDLDPVTFAQEFQNTTLHIFQQMWELSNPIEQTLLMLIALSELKGRLRNQRYDISNIDNIFSQQELELDALVGQGVIKRQYTEDKINYSFASSIMEWWVVKKIQNSNETELEQRKKVFLNVMSSKQAEKVTTAIRWLWNNKDQVPSILEWIGKVTAALPKGAIGG